MKQLQVRALAVMMTLWCGSFAQENANVATAAQKTAPQKAATGTQTVAKVKPSEKVKPETKYKALVDRRKAEQESRVQVESHLGNIRRIRSLEVVEEKAEHKEREEKSRTPVIEDKAKKDSTRAGK